MYKTMRLFITVIILFVFVFCQKAESQTTYQPVEKTSAAALDTGTVHIDQQPEFTNAVTGQSVKVMHGVKNTGFHFYNSLSFKSKEEGIIAGGTRLRIGVTQDGGRHWKNFSFSRFANAFYSTAINDGDMYVVGASKYIFRSPNIGTSWEVFDVSTLGKNKYALRYPKFYKIKFAPDGFGLIVGENDGDPLVLKTTNNGRSWQLVHTEGLQEEGVVSDLTLLEGQVARIVTSKGDIYESTDRAETWSIIHKGEKNESLNSIAFKNKQEGYVSGLNSLLLKTTDGGNNWERINTDVLSRNANISNIEYISENSILITTAKSYQDKKFNTFAYTVDGKGQIKPFMLGKNKKEDFIGDAYGLYILKNNAFLLDRDKLYRTSLN
jgi:photosystem II stability/assembly factor-like uncharacterized protein